MEINQSITPLLVMKTSIKNSLKKNQHVTCSFKIEKSCRKSDQITLSNYLQNPDIFRPHSLHSHNYPPSRCIIDYNDPRKMYTTHGMPQQNPNSPPWPSLNKENSNYAISPILLNNVPPFNGKSKDSFPFHTDPSLHYYCNREYELSPEQLRKTKNISSELLFASFELLQGQGDYIDYGFIPVCEPFTEIKNFSDNFEENNNIIIKTQITRYDEVRNEKKEKYNTKNKSNMNNNNDIDNDRKKNKNIDLNFKTYNY